MDILALRWGVDLGLVVLIWLVQLVIYPSFRYYAAMDLLRWHRLYTARVTLVVFPLMMAQLALALWMIIWERTTYTVLGLLGVLLLFGLTATIFVPLHRMISEAKADKVLLEQLVQKNWWRTAIWTALFLWSSVERFVLG